MRKSGAYPLELSGEAFTRLVNEATTRLAHFLDTLPEQPASGLDDVAARARAVVEPLPEHGTPAEELLTQLFESVFPVSLNTTSAGYLAYIPGGGLPHAAVADLISLTLNRYVGLWAVAPVVAEIEATVIRWLCALVGFSGDTGGFLTSGGSLANWSALVLARDKGAPEDFERAVVYTSDQAHHSVAKAARLAGFRNARVRQIGTDAAGRIELPALAHHITSDRRAGLQPLVVVAQGGSTNTGAVDDLEQLADLAERERMWLHVDAAYGGFFLLTDHGRAVLRGIQRADSVTLDPHKGLFLPYGTGCLLAKRRADLHQVFAGRGEYMTARASGEFTDFCDLSPELSRDFRGLRLWLPLKMHGVAPFRELLDEKLHLTRYAADELRKLPGIKVVMEPTLSVVAFRYDHSALSDQELDERNQQLLDRVNRQRRVVLSSTRLNGRVVLRICVLSFRTHRDRVDECLECIRRGLESLDSVA
ncbi:MAG: aspartate aminotransferase family protein [Pirellulaceae bacterium]